MVLQSGSPCSSSGDAARVAVSLAPAVMHNTMGSADSLLLLAAADLTEIRVWSPEPKADFCLVGSIGDRYIDMSQRHDVSEVVQKLCEANAWPESMSYLILEDHQGDAERVLEELKGWGVVRLSSLVQRAAWEFYEPGFMLLQPRVNLASGRRFLRSAGDVLEKKKAEDLHVYELMEALDKRGWCHRVSVGTPEPYPLQSEHDAEKSYWSRPGDNTIGREYLLVLLLACTEPDFVQRLADRAVKGIPHLQAGPQYDAFLRVRKQRGAAGHVDIEFEEEGPLKLQVKKHGLPDVASSKGRNRHYRLAKSFQWGFVSFLWRPATDKNHSMATK